MMRNQRLMFTVNCTVLVGGLLCGPMQMTAVAAKPNKAAAKANKAAKPKRPPPGPIIEPRQDNEAAPEPEALETPQEALPQAAAEPEQAEVPAPRRPAENPMAPETLRARYDELRDQVFRSRARRETVEQALLSTKIAFELRWQGNRKYRLDKAEIRLDGIRIWDASERPVTEDPISLTERPAAPGLHRLTVRLEVKSRDKVEMGYASEQNFTIALPEGKLSRVRILVDEDGSLPSYNPEIEIELDSE